MPLRVRTKTAETGDLDVTDPIVFSGLPLDKRAVMSFLLFDRALPRSVLYSLDEARRPLFDRRRDEPLGRRDV